MGKPPDYEPPEEMSTAAIAAREGARRTRWPTITSLRPRTGTVFPGRELHGRRSCADPRNAAPTGTLLGLSDGGAHYASIVDAGVPSYMLAHWGRDRRRGPRLPLEYLVKRQTSETADFFGLTDRGRIAPGLRADINLIDFDRLRLHQPEFVNDIPADGRRFVQRVEGYEATLVAGSADLRARRATGALPGRLVRAGRIGAASRAG